MSIIVGRWPARRANDRTAAIGRSGRPRCGTAKRWYHRTMPVLESLVASVVAETSERMRDAQFAQVAVGNFVQSQPELASYLSGRASRIGGAQGVLEVAFHAELLCECLRQARSGK